MNRKEAIQMFVDHELPAIQNAYEQDGIPDYIARRECWINWLDYMCKDGNIEYDQSKDWDYPECCES